MLSIQLKKNPNFNCDSNINKKVKNQKIRGAKNCKITGKIKKSLVNNTINK